MARDGDGRRGGRGDDGGALGRVLERNIRALLERRRREERARSTQERLAEWLGRFAGSMPFVWIHAAVVAAWVAMNVGLLPGPRFDPDFVKLATAASVEAIFLTTFVLVTQNRMAAVADQRADLDLQISLLAEHELTRLIRLADEMARRLGVDPEAREREVGETRRDVDPDEVLDRIEEATSSDRDAPHHPT
jgi:uncharacterized membrane protein